MSPEGVSRTRYDQVFPLSDEPDCVASQLWPPEAGPFRKVIQNLGALSTDTIASSRDFPRPRHLHQRFPRRQRLPVFLRPVPRSGFCPSGGFRQVEHRGFAVIVVEPGVNEESVFRDREVVSEFCFPDPCRGIIRVVIPHDFPAEPVGDDARASPAIARRMIAAGEYMLIPRKSFEASFAGVPVHRADIARIPFPFNSYNSGVRGQ